MAARRGSGGLQLDSAVVFCFNGLVFDLDNAGLEVVLDAEAPSVLRAFGPAEKDAPGAGIAVVSEAGAIVVRRAGMPSGAHGGAPAPGPRLRLELVTGPGRRLEIYGSDLDVMVKAPPEVGTGDEDDDEEDDEGEEEEDEDDEGEDDGDDQKDGQADALTPRPVEVEDPYDLVLEVAGSSVDLIGVAGVRVTAAGSFVHAAGTRGHLTLDLEGGTAELEDHRGALELTSRDGEVTLTEVHGRVVPAVSGGSLVIRGGVGQVDGRFDDALLRLDGWRVAVRVVGNGATVEARALLGTRMEVRGAGHEVAVDELQGFLFVDLDGGGLTAGKLRGKRKSPRAAAPTSPSTASREARL